jgi:hypothetical protein
MNRTTTTIIILILTISGLWAQAPDQFSYQIIVRDSQGQPLAGQTLTMDVNVLSGSISGPSVFSESHQVTSTSSGQVSLMVGSVNDLSTIAWENGPFFLQVSANGQPVETRQLLSVPYAKHTMKASQVPTLDYTNLMGTPDFSNWDKDPTDDFDGEFNSLLNMWSKKDNHLYYNKGNINIQSSNFTPEDEALNVNGAILYNGAATDTVPGALFFDPAGNGSFRFFDNNGMVKVLGTGTITFNDPDPVSGNVVKTSDIIWKNRLNLGENAYPGYDFKDNVMALAGDSLRIYFYDTSSTGAFPTTDWQFRFNDLENGGDNYFAIYDSTYQTTPVKISAGTTSNAIFIDTNGDVGFGINIPSQKADVAGNVAATSFVGDGSALTGISGGTSQIENTGSTTIGADSDNNGSGDIIFETANQSRLAIQNAGKIKIGSNDPAEADLDASGLNSTMEDLEVSGEIQAASKITLTTTITNPTNASYTFDAAIPEEVVFFDSAIGAINISGFMNGVDGQRVTIVNKGANTVTIQPFGGGQLIFTLGFTSLPLSQYDSATFIFNRDKWNCLEVIQ